MLRCHCCCCCINEKNHAGWQNRFRYNFQFLFLSNHLNVNNSTAIQQNNTNKYKKSLCLNLFGACFPDFERVLNTYGHRLPISCSERNIWICQLILNIGRPLTYKTPLQVNKAVSRRSFQIRHKLQTTIVLKNFIKQGPFAKKEQHEQN